ncbi:glycoprotease family-domain-containing protein [Whalleya microplaca]|nr:glycoprotease family-domain-containing protein [Whalleya microplaca]
MNGMIRYLDTANDVSGSATWIPPHAGELSIFQGTLLKVSMFFAQPSDNSLVDQLGPIILIGDACKTSTGQMDCPRVCADPSVVFSSWQIQWNCLTLAALALAIPEFPVDDSTAAIVDSAISHFELGNIEDFDAWGVLNATYSCVTASCEDRSTNNCPVYKPENFSIYSPSALGDMYHILSTVCYDELDDEPNVDIAGPGVTIAYGIQISIALYAWALIRLVTVKDTLNWVMIPFLRFRGITTLFTTRHPRLHAFLARTENWNSTHALSTLLAEFQEAQCFFVMAIQIALLYGNSQSADYVEADNMRFRPPPSQSRRHLLTLAIESSCDDTCVAVLEKTPSGAAHLHFNRKVTSDHRDTGGVHPLSAVISHTEHLAPLVREALRALPAVPSFASSSSGSPDPEEKKRNGVASRSQSERDRDRSRRDDVLWVDGQPRVKPDFVAVTRGPGMASNLAAGLNLAKGLAVAWDVPLLGVHHMQAHALTPRLVSALKKGERERGRESQHEQISDPRKEKRGDEVEEPHPQFPFLSLLVSGGHTLLVHSRGLNDHEILAEAMNIAIGDMIDKCARLIVPETEIFAGKSTMYGPLLEKFAFPDNDEHNNSTTAEEYDYAYTPPPNRLAEIQPFDSGLGWTLTPPLSATTALAFDFSGFNSQVQNVFLRRPADSPSAPISERRILARHAMRMAFEHLGSRLLLALQQDRHRAVRTVVVAGGVASNRFLLHVLRAMLDARGFAHVELRCPPLALCTDNAAMIAWTGFEMYEAGWRSELGVLPIRKWPLDPRVEGGGVLGAWGWRNVEGIGKGEGEEGRNGGDTQRFD